MTQATFGDPRVLERVWRRVVINEATGCWEWSGCTRAGYGAVRIGGRQGFTHPTHRYVYETLIGPVPGLTLDHLCRVRHCCNPAHLEPVTIRENSLRGMSPQVIIWRTGICKHGHSMGDAYVSPRGTRHCRTCRNERSRALRRRWASGELARPEYVNNKRKTVA